MENKNVKSKFNIREQNKANTLYCDDKPVLCIYKTPVVLPHLQLQNTAVVNMPYCSDECPMFNLTPGLFGKLKFECTKHEIDIYTLTPLQK
jgi:hypothetical protein